jgi:hypothetical protein
VGRVYASCVVLALGLLKIYNRWLGPHALVCNTRNVAGSGSAIETIERNRISQEKWINFAINP